MRTLAVILTFVFLSAVTNRLQAQSSVSSLQNTNWKWYLEALHDTLTMHIGTDTSWTTSSVGEVIVKSTCKMDKDTLRIKDVSGMYVCQEGEGVYKLTVDGDYLGFSLITDPCPNRADALSGIKMKRAASK